MKPLRYILLFFLLFSLVFPQSASAHAVLEKADPTQDYHLQSSPKKITLTFNERLEDEFFSIKVFDDNGEEISGSRAKLSIDHKQLIRSIPTLKDGNYTVSYQVISADGHPVKGSYIFSVGEALADNNKAAELQPENQGSPLTSIGRIIYFLGLLLTAGWIWWGAWARKHLAEFEEVKQSYKNRARLLLMFFLLATIGFGAIIASGYLEQWNLNNVMTMITDTTAGQSWSISMILAILGFVVLFRHPWVDRLWVVLVLAAKSINGHAFAFEPKVITVLLDFIHLLAASIWSGGLLYIVMYLKKFPTHIGNFMRRYSRSALISMMVLIGTGLLSTFMYLPKIQYLFVTKWGTLLLIKTILVLLVIVVAGVIRFFLKKQTDKSIRHLIKVDFILMISITCIVGVLTYLSPIPENKPLNWHEKVAGLEFAAFISPNVPGDNSFMVEAISKQAGLGIKRMELNLIYKDNADVAPIHVPLEADGQGEYVHSMTDGSYLPFAGNWTAEVRILDTEDNEKVYRKDFVVY